ncbi:MAG: hemolysin III family protein [Bacilli bacterium]|nr:hemolysin III family protein [Bacilli bacterium]
MTKKKSKKKVVKKKETTTLNISEIKELVKEEKRLKKERITLPNYTLGEELISSISHGVGALLSIAALVLCIVFAAKEGSAIAVVSSCIYGTSLIILYLMSCLYHALARNKAKKVFRVFDHCSIFLLIAGTYTPFLLITIGGVKGIIMMFIMWISAITGIVLNAINLEKYDKMSFVLYLIMGWMIVFSFKQLLENLPTPGFVLLLVGGIIYTVGAAIYAIGDDKIKYLHSIWHFFVLGGSIFQFFTILLYVI